MIQYINNPGKFDGKMATLEKIFVDEVLKGTDPDHSRELIQFNKFLATDIGIANIIEEARKQVAEDKEKIKNHTFSWKEPDVQNGIPARKANVTLLQDNGIYDLLRLGIDTELRDIFDLDYIKMIMDQVNTDFGQQSYYSAVRYQSSLLMFFIHFHLFKDFGKFPHFDILTIHSSDPFIREKIRTNARNDPFLREKYFNEAPKFNLIQFVEFIHANYIYNVTSRVITENSNCHVDSVRLIKFLFEYGLVDDPDTMKRLLRLMVTKSDNLTSLERAINDEEKTESTHEFIELSKEAKSYMAEAIVHITYMELDKQFLAFFRKTIGLSKVDLVAHLSANPDALQIDKEIIGAVNALMFKFCMSTTKVKEQYMLNERGLKIADRFINLANKELTNDFEIIFRYITLDYLQFMHKLGDPDNENPYLYTDTLNLATEINANLMQFLDKSLKGENWDKPEELNKNLENILKPLALQLNLEPGLSNDSPDVDRQIAIFHSNLYFTLIRCGFYLLDGLNSTSIQTILSILGYMCYDLPSLEGLLIGMEESQMMMAIYHKFKVEVADLYSFLFTNNSMIILENEEIFDKFMKEFKIFLDLIKENKIWSYQDAYLCVKWSEVFKGFFDWKKYSVRRPCLELKYSTIIAPYLKEFISHWPTNSLAQYKKVIQLDAMFAKRSSQPIPEDDKEALLVDVTMNLMESYNLSCYYCFSLSAHMDSPAELLKQHLPRFEKSPLTKSTAIEYIYNNLIAYNNKIYDYGEQEILLPNPAKLRVYQSPVENIAMFLMDQLKLVLRDATKEQSSAMKAEYMQYWEGGLLMAISGFFSNLIQMDDVTKHYHNFLTKEQKDKIASLIIMIYDNRNEIQQTFGYRNVASKFEEEKELKAQIESMKAHRTGHNTKMDLFKIVRTGFKMMSCIYEETTYADKEHKKIFKQRNMYENRLKPKNSVMRKSQTAKRIPKTPVPSIYSYYRKKMNKYVTKYFDNYFEDFTKYLEEASDTIVDIKENVLTVIERHFNIKPHQIPTSASFYQNLSLLRNFLEFSTEVFQKCLEKLCANGVSVYLDLIGLLFFELKRMDLIVVYKYPRNKIWKRNMWDAVSLLRLYQLFCEQNNQYFKNALRTVDEQEHRIVAFLTCLDGVLDGSFLCLYPKALEMQEQERPELIPLIVAHFNLLAETMSGPCVENQKEVCDLHYDQFNRLLVRVIRDMDSPLYDVKLAIMQYLQAMVEGLNYEVVGFQAANIDVTKIYDIVIDAIKSVYLTKVKMEPLTNLEDVSNNFLYKDYQRLVKEYKCNMDVSSHKVMKFGTEIYFWMLNVVQKNASYKVFLDERQELLDDYLKAKKLVHKYIKEEEIAVLAFLNAFTKSIDYIDDDENFRTVYFLQKPECFYLTERTRTAFMEEVDVDSQVIKLNALLSNKRLFFEEMDFNYKFFTKHPWMNYIGSNYRQFELIALGIAVVINILIIAKYIRTPENEVPDYSYRNEVIFFATIQIFLSAFLTGGWLNVRYYLEVRVQKENYKKTMLVKPEGFSLEAIKYYLHVYLIDSFLTQVETRTFLWHMFCCSLGLTVSDIFFTLSLVIIVNSSRDLLYVFKSITEHGEQLALTAVLGLVTVIIYSNISFWYFGDYFQPIEQTNNSQQNDVCNRLYECFFVVLNFGFRNGGGIGDVTVADTFYEGRSRSMPKVLLDVTFFFVINIIFLNLIFGIIIDTFGELRTISSKKENDMDNICFICGLQMMDIARAGEEFNMHRETVHNPWSYIFFYYRLSKMTEMDMSGEEIFIFRNFEAKNIQIFPVNRPRNASMSSYSDVCSIM